MSGGRKSETSGLAADSQRRNGRWESAAFQGPSLLVLVLIVVFPLIYSATLSLQSYSPVLPDRTGQWIGLENFQRVLHDRDFFNVIIVTLVFVICAVTIETILGTVVGIILHRLVRLRRAVTSLLLLPMITTPLIVGLMFNFAFNAQFGYLTWVMSKIGLDPNGGVLNSGITALAALIFVDVWEWFPFIALMVVAGLSALPVSPFEAASIDGASTFQTYRYIMLPMLKPVLVVAILFRATEAVREFDKVFILTGGGPGAATTVNDLYQYRVSFLNWDLSYGAALGLVTFVVVLALCGVLYRVLTRNEAQL
jgi:multiple sugar transport system permease protein